MKSEIVEEAKKRFEIEKKAHTETCDKRDGRCDMLVQNGEMDQCEYYAACLSKENKDEPIEHAFILGFLEAYNLLKYHGDVITKKSA